MGNEECVNSCVCNSPPSPISMFSLCSRLWTPSTRITLLTSPFLCRVSGRCGHGSPCEQLCYELHDGMYECVCKDGYILHKNGYSCAGECANRCVCVNRFDPLIPLCNSHSWRTTSLISVIKFRVASGRQQTFSRRSYCFQSTACFQSPARWKYFVWFENIVISRDLFQD